MGEKEAELQNRLWFEGGPEWMGGITEHAEWRKEQQARLQVGGPVNESNWETMKCEAYLRHTSSCGRNTRKMWLR